MPVCSLLTARRTFSLAATSTQSHDYSTSTVSRTTLQGSQDDHALSAVPGDTSLCVAAAANESPAAQAPTYAACVVECVVLFRACAGFGSFDLSLCTGRACCT